MAKAYSKASTDVMSRIDRLREDYYPELDGVQIQALFVFEDEPGPCLKHGGYAAAAVTKIVPVAQRAAGLGDAIIVVDRYVWEHLPTKAKDALLDHELYHIERDIDEKSGRPKADVLGRPKLKLRLHDHQLGWFDEIAQRHGEWSIEVRQAKQLMETGKQLYFDFGKKGDGDEQREAA